MFYSHSLLSRKGPLGTIWVAAHCFKKLKRDQIDDTDISSSVDKIMPEIQISYRVLAHLLLGIVRIFSKKVDYLYHDCNEALNCIRKSFAPAQCSRKKGAVTKTHDHSREAKGHTKAHRIGLSEDPIFAVPAETMCDPYHCVTISVPERLELDSFELDVPDDEDVASDKPFQQSTPQDHLLDDHDDPYFQNEYNHRESATLYEMNSPCFTPVNDVLPPCMIGLELHGEYNIRSGEEKEDNLQGDIRSHRQLEVKKSLAPILTNGESESIQMMKTVDSDTMEDVNNLEKSVEPSASHETFLSNDKILPVCTNEDADAIPTHAMETKSLSPILTNGESDLQLYPVQLRNTIDSGTAEDINNLEKSLEPSVSHKTFSSIDKNVTARTSEDAIATDPTKHCQEDLMPCELGVPSPRFTVRTPAKKEYRPMLKKRKKILFDKTIVLSNETLRKGLHDASSLVSKRRKLPHTYLDVWKVNKISNLVQNFEDPLITCMAPELKVLFQSSNSFSRSLDVPVDQHLKSADAENKACTSSKDAGKEMSITSIEFADSYNETVVEFLPPEDTGVPRTDNLSVTETKTVSEPSAGLNFMDQELELVENHAIGQDDGWTRFVAQYLRRKLLHHKGEEQKASFSLQDIVKGSKRPDCARFFYEILILKGHQCIDVNQDSPFGEIVISPTPKLVAEFNR